MEISKVTSLRLTGNGETAALDSLTQTITPGSTKRLLLTMEIAASGWTEIDLTALLAIRQLGIENNDATNYVKFALDNAGAQLFCERLDAGDRLILPGAPTTLYAQADTAAVDITIVAAERLLSGS